MNVLLINNYFPPEIGAASHLFYYLGKELAKRGHKVYVLTGVPRYNVSYEEYKHFTKNMDKITHEVIDGMNVFRVKLPLVERSKKIRRGLEHFEIANKLLRAGKKILKNKSIDVSLTYSPPLTLYKTAYRLGKQYDFPSILNVQDLFPQAAIDLGIMKSKAIISFFKRLEKRAYEKSDLITVHSETNAKYVEKIVNSKKVLVFENWIDINLIKPGEKRNKFSEENNLFDKFIISFAGTLGYSQDVEVILNAAEITKNHDIYYLIVGDGVKYEQLKSEKEKRNLKKIILLPSVPKEIYPFVLHTSDISLATLTKDVRTPVVPSKILSIMSAGIPVIATMNLDGDAPKLIEKAKAGYALPAGDAKGLAEKILELYNNPDLRKKLGKNGREYVEKNLSVQVAADKYEEIFKRVINEYKRRSKNG